MCLGIPMQVVEVANFRAVCAADGERCPVDTVLIDGGVALGDFLLVHRGRALRKLDEAEAAAIADALKALTLANAGQSFDHLFADLVGREPPLPEHLRAADTRK